MGTLLLCACSTNELTIDKVNEDDYSNVTELNGFVRDALTLKKDNIVELYRKPIESSLYFGCARAPKKGLDVVLSYDADYAAAYNSFHETDFQLYPADKVTLKNGGKIVVAPDEKQSYPIAITIAPSEGLEADATYLVPIKATCSTEGVQVAEEHSVYLVKNYQEHPFNTKSPSDVKTFLYYEVNDVNPLNASTIIREDNVPFFDYVCMFASNINYDREKGEVYVLHNENITYILNHREELLVPLQKMGIKVIMGLLGNHDESGLCQLSEEGAKDFARKIKANLDAYGLDGVNFDDEYSNAPDLSNPLFAPRSGSAGARLVYETKKLCPDKHVSVYAYGSMFSGEDVDGVGPGDYLDAAVADYGGRTSPRGNMSWSQCSGFSWQMNYNPSGASESTGQNVVNGGYGYAMMFAMYNNKNRQAQVNSLDGLSKGLYGVGIRQPEGWYHKNATTLSPLSE